MPQPWSQLAVVVVGVLAGLGLAWLGLIGALWVTSRRAGSRLRGVVRVGPDLLRLVRLLAADPSLSRGIRVRLWLLLAYLASPIDLVPDVIPVLGYADDALVTVLVLRAVIRAAGDEALTRHWPGTDEGLAAVRRLVGPRSRTGR